MSNPDFSKDSFFEFIEYVSKKGLIKQATASNWRNAASRLLAILEKSETRDLRELDVEALCNRFMNLESGSVTPSSMKVYRSRLRAAVGDFIAYKTDPMSYKPGIEQRSSRKKAATSEKTQKSKNKRENMGQTRNNSSDFEHERGSEHQSKGGGITFPVPLREDLVVQIKNLPHDLTSIEAEKISKVIKALASHDALKE